MEPSREGAELNGMALSAVIRRFGELPVPDPHEWVGRHRGEILGPAWVRASAGPFSVNDGFSCAHGWMYHVGVPELHEPWV